MSDYEIPYELEQGEPARAVEVNANFAVLLGYLNDMHSSVLPDQTSKVGYLHTDNGTLTWASALPGSGTVTSVSAGDGMLFDDIVGSGDIVLGTPSSITTSSINETMENSHTHALDIPDITLMGNEFNTASELVQLDGDGKLPTLDGSALINIQAHNSTVVEAGEDLEAGSIVNIYEDNGISKVQRANSTDASKPAHGFVLSNVQQGDLVTVYFDGSIPNFPMLSIGVFYYLDVNSGGVTSTPPSDSGNIQQEIGFATSTTTLLFQRGIVKQV